jgi:hypothetical protein
MGTAAPDRDPRRRGARDLTPARRRDIVADSAKVMRRTRKMTGRQVSCSPPAVSASARRRRPAAGMGRGAVIRQCRVLADSTDRICRCVQVAHRLPVQTRLPGLSREPRSRPHFPGIPRGDVLSRRQPLDPQKKVSSGKCDVSPSRGPGTQPYACSQQPRCIAAATGSVRSFAVTGSIGVYSLERRLWALQTEQSADCIAEQQ